MQCEEFVADYSDFLDSEFEAHSPSDYHYHLQRCSSCADYDRVMRHALQLVRQLEPPEANPDFLPRLQRRAFELANRRPGYLGARGRTAAAAGLMGLGLMAVASLAVVNPGRETVELPPVVVEPSPGEEPPSLWGPAPRFAPAASLLRVPDIQRNPLLATPTRKLSLFRAGLRASVPAADAGAVATE
ncbi:MAG: hypothetical protein JSV41_10840 [Gemmatimonadota bacterium]|nr:MAG: hypothetical protein JSV41_10840 [Gemmatimonadota bacterium]